MLAFWILAALVFVSTIAVVVLPNPLHSALCLVANFVGVAGIYALLGAHFLAAVQIIVYAGAIMVLVVFVLMLLNVKGEKRSFSDALIAVVALAAAGFCIKLVFPLIEREFQSGIFLTSRPASAQIETGDISQLGQLIFGDQAILFQLTGVVLITAIIGAVMLASPRKQPKKAGDD